MRRITDHDLAEGQGLLSADHETTDHETTEWMTSEGQELAAAGERVLRACREANEAGQTHLRKVVIAGLMLIEHREALIAASSSHSGKNSWQGKQKADSDKFSCWLESNGLSKTTAYRWMDGAERIATSQLGLQHGMDFPLLLDAGGEATPLSQVLLAAPERMSPKAREFRQGLFDFLEDKTLSEAVRAVMDGDSPGHRISRAANGKRRGGAPDMACDPESRKKFPLYCGKALAEALAHIGARVSTGTGRRTCDQGGHWPNLTEEQKQETREYAALFIAGLDAELIRFLAEAAQRELLDRKKGKPAEPLALRRDIAPKLALRGRTLSKHKTT